MGEPMLSLRYRVDPAYVTEQYRCCGAMIEPLQVRSFRLDRIPAAYRDGAVRYAQIGRSCAPADWPVISELATVEQIVDAWVELEAAAVRAPDDLSGISGV